MYLSATNLGDGLLGKISPDQLEAVQVITDNVQQLRRLVDDLLDATRMSEGKVPIEVGRVQLVELAAAAARRHQNRGGMVDSPTCFLSEDDVPAVLADRQRVVQILDNLLSNAAKYATGAPVTVSVARDVDEPEFIRVSVADEGPGIASEDFDRVFERMIQLEQSVYHTRRGLGLYISRDLALPMKGDLWVQETEGGGSTFCVRLPMHRLDAMLVPRIVAARSSAPLELVVVDVDVSAERGDLGGTDFADELIAHVQAVIEGSNMPVAVIRHQASGYSLRCITLGSDESGAAERIQNLLNNAAGLVGADLEPKLTTQVVKGSKARRRSAVERIEEIADTVLG